MGNTLVYRLSLGLTILLTLTAFFTFLGWLGFLINGVGHLPALHLLPWNPLGCIVFAAINCTIRARFIVHQRAVTA
jgi:hypothetical protein